MADELLIPIAADTDVVTARQRGRELAAEAGFSSGDQTVIAGEAGGGPLWKADLDLRIASSFPPGKTSGSRRVQIV